MIGKHRAWLAALGVLFLAACSGVKLAYNQLDWVVPIYLEGYVDLDRAQSRVLKTHVGEMLQWHCGTQLSGYAQDLRAINARFQRGNATPASLAPHYTRILEYWQAIRAQAAPRVAELLASATGEQIEELFAGFEKENAKLKAEHVDRPEAERREAARKLMRGRLEDWIGRLTPAQREILAAWSEELALNGVERLQFRQRWQAELRRALEQRADPLRFRAAVQDLIAHPERHWSAAHAARQERGRERLLTLLARIGATLTPAQREHLARRAESWAESFEQLACSPMPVQAAASVPARAN